MNDYQSWYSKSWPRKSKAAAVTEVARESISATDTIASERLPTHKNAPSTQRPTRPPSIGLTKIGSASTRSLPADAATTRLNIASIKSSSVPDMSDATPQNSKSHEDDAKNIERSSTNTVTETPTDTKYESDTKEVEAKGDIPESKPTNNASTAPEPVEKTEEQPSGWFDWLSWSKSDTKSDTKREQETHQQAKSEPVDSENENREQNIHHGDSENTEQIQSSHERPPSPRPSSESTKKRSWLQMWTGSLVSLPGSDTPQDEPKAPQQQDLTDPSKSRDEGDESQVQAPLRTVSPEPEGDKNEGVINAESQSQKSSGWLFWSSKETSNGPANHNLTQADPETVSSTPLNKDLVNTGVSDPKTNSETKGQSDQSHETAAGENDQVLRSNTPSTPLPGKTSQSPSSIKKSPELTNQLLPAVTDTFAVADRPGFIEQISRLLRYSKEPPQARHVSLVPDPPRVKKALAVGIHGYFPAPFFRTVIGQPTGTSVKFSTQAAKAIQEWADSRSISCEIENIALEGEGRIEERVDILWKLLLNRIEDIRTADLIMVSCHSQGVPVATMLVAKLISFGCVNAARIGICAMAGVNLGPFPDYRSRWISGSAGELFDFANPNSKVSQDYMASLNAILDFGVKVVYVGSIDDQLVSLEVRITQLLELIVTVGITIH